MIARAKPAPETWKLGERQILRSAGGEVGPEGVGAAGGHGGAELARPRAFAAELGAPRPEPARGEVERVLVGEADGAVRLVRDAGADAGRLAHADLRHRDLESCVITIGGAECGLGGDAGGGHVTGEHGEILLDHLEAADGSTELLALGGIPD